MESVAEAISSYLAAARAWYGGSASIGKPQRGSSYKAVSCTYDNGTLDEHELAEELIKVVEVCNLCHMLWTQMAERRKWLESRSNTPSCPSSLPRNPDNVSRGCFSILPSHAYGVELSISSPSEDMEVDLHTFQLSPEPLANTISPKDTDDKALKMDSENLLQGSCCYYWRDRCTELENKVSLLEAQCSVLVNQAPFDKAAILDRNLKCVKASRSCYLASQYERNGFENLSEPVTDIGLKDSENSWIPGHLLCDLQLMIRSEETNNPVDRRGLTTTYIPLPEGSSDPEAYILLGRFLDREEEELSGALETKSEQEKQEESTGLEDEAIRHSTPEFSPITLRLIESDLEKIIQYMHLFDLIPQIVFITKPDGQTVYCNNAYYKVSGGKRGDPYEFDWRKCLHPEDKDRCANSWKRAISEQSPYLSEHRLFDCATQSVRWYLCRALPIRNRKGEIVWWFGTCTDVNDLKNAQKELVLMQQRTNAVVSNCFAILWAVDTKGVFTFYRGLTASRLGVNPSDRVGQSFFVLNKERPEAIAALERSLAGETTKIELAFHDNWLETTLTPLYEENHLIVGCVGVSVDVTERKKHALELLKWEKVFYNSRCGLTISIPGQTILNANPAFAEMHGGVVEDFIGKPTSMVLNQDTLQLVPELKKRFEETKHITYESLNKRLDGSTFPALTDCSAVCDASGNVLYSVASIIDLTESKMAEEERARLQIKEQSALQASKLKSKFLAMMSHEIRTPLNGIIGMIDLACDGAQGTEQKQFLRTARQSASTLLTIINDILDLSKIEAGKLELEIIDMDLLEVVRDVVLMLSFSAQSKGVSMAFKSNGLNSCFVKGDPVRLRQVITNLLSNAIKFTSEGKITLSLEVVNHNDNKQRKRVSISVQDTGIGIHPEILPTLFLPFSQADLSTTRRFGGTGLGLSISRQLITLMQGEISAESTLGKGSKFSFTVEFEEGSVLSPHNKRAMSDGQTEDGIVTASPTVSKRRRTESQVAEEAKANMQPNQTSQVPSAVRVLVVDDNRVNQVVTSKLLQRLGYQTHCASNGIEAVKAVHAGSFDVVLMDCHMPEMDGYEATRQIRQSEVPEVRSLRVVALTANALIGERDKCLDAGMDDYLSKPISKESLSQVMAKWSGPNHGGAHNEASEAQTK